MATEVPVIVGVDTAPVRMQARPELAVHGARGAHEWSDFLLVRVRAQTPAGQEVSGYGEVSGTLVWSGEDSVTASYLVQEVLTPLLLGQPLAPVAALESAMDKVLAGHPFTKAGLSTAMWDCWARVLDLPLAVVLGGPFRRQIPVKISLSGDGPVLEAAFHAAHEAGFRAFKVKVGLDLAADIRRVGRVRELAGPEAFVAVDANGGWSRSDARRAASLLGPYDVAFIEQPCTPEDRVGPRQVREAGALVVADESVFSLADVVAVGAEQAADTVSVYIGKAGGPGRAVQQASVAAALGMSCLIGSNGELGIAAAAQVHVACAVPALRVDLPSDIIGAHYYGADVIAKPLDHDGRVVRLPEGPGLGVEPAPDVLELFESPNTSREGIRR